jgi:hypothetical protein
MRTDYSKLFRSGLYATLIVAAVVAIFSAAITARMAGNNRIKHRSAPGIDSGGENVIINVLSNSKKLTAEYEATYHKIVGEADGKICDYNREEFIDSIRCELSRYGNIINRVLEEVIVCDRLHVIDKDGGAYYAGGMYFDKTVVITIRSADGQCAEISSVFHLLHHEVSSLILFGDYFQKDDVNAKWSPVASQSWWWISRQWYVGHATDG